MYLENYTTMKKCLLTAFLMVFFTGAFAQPGVLDQTFGVGGKVISPFPSTTSMGFAIAQQSDGKLIISHGSDDPAHYLGGELIRMNINGSIDTSYHGEANGYVIYSLTLQQDQKLLAICHQPIYYPSGGTYDWDSTFLIRFNTNGKIDRSFGVNGKYFLYKTQYYPAVTNIIIRPNGKILIGYSISSDLRLYQFFTNGTLDSSFGINGFIDVPNSFSYNSEYGLNTQKIFGIALSSDEHIYIGGANRNQLTNTETVTFMRYSSSGLFDTTYGNNGYADANFGSKNFYFEALALTSNNNGVITGHFYDSLNYRQIALICFDSTGVLNNNFGVGGKVFPILGTIDNHTTSINILKNGKIVIGGHGGGGTSYPVNDDFYLLKYNFDGSLDSLFGIKGIVQTDVSNIDICNASLIQNDGKIVLLGYTYTSYYPLIAVVRYDSTERAKYNSLIVSTFFDKNSNGIKDVNETTFPFGKLVATKLGIDTIVFNFSGQRTEVYLDSGSYTTKYFPYLTYHNVIPATHVTSNTTFFHTDSVTFAVQPIPGQRDASVLLIPYGSAKPGFQNNHHIAYENNGTDTVANGTIQLIKSNKLNFNNATPTPLLISGDTLTWNISNLKPLNTGYILLNFTVKSPPTVNIGDTIQSTVTITSNKPDLTPADNTSTVKQIVRGSYDPNDKTESHGGKISTLQVANGEYLQYTIRFQNTGNDTAFNVYIRDTLDNKLDWNTMQILTASHSYQMTMNDGNKCLFTLRNINLVDSTNNEPGSHGYIVYKVKPKATVALGDTIKNTAAIYFDYNLPVHTNTETTLIISEVLPLRLLSFTAKKENKTNRLSWTTTNEINVDHFEIERSNNGREFNKIGNTKANSTTQTNSYQYSDAVAPNTPLWGAGGLLYYRIKIVDKDGKFEYSPIRMISNNTDGQISIYPNPARDMVTVTHPSTNIVAQLQITDMNGRILRRATVATSTVQINMNVKGLPAGKYNITWSNGLISHTQALVIE